MATTKATDANYFSLLDLPLLGKVVRTTGELSKMARVSRCFKKAADEEAIRIMKGLASAYGSYPIQCILDHFSVANHPITAQVDVLFHASKVSSKAMNPLAVTPYHSSLLKENISPFVQTDDMIKFWLAVQKVAPSSLAKKMGRVEFNGDPQILAKKLGSLLKLYQNELVSIENLDLRNLGLHTLPREIELLVNLKGLNLSGNRLADLPKEIGHLEKLTRLILDKNRLTTLPLGVCNLRALESLSVFSNRLEEIPEEIGNLANLSTLFLGSNRIKTLPIQIGDLSSLICLSLENNCLESLPQSIGGMMQLRALFLYGNLLREVPRTIGLLTELRFLSLASNRLSFLPKELTHLHNLETLLLSNNAIKELSAGIGALSSLRTLFVDRNHLDSLPSAIQNLSELENFCCEGNRFESIPKEFVNLSPWTSAVLNDSSSLDELRRVYSQLGSDKWKECIDGEFHKFGPEVFDKGLHGKYAEPNFVVSMRALFDFLSKNMNQNVDADFYLQMHQIACSHFIGEKGGTEIDKKKVGIFRGEEDRIDADFKEEEYPFTKEGIHEFNELSTRLTIELGPVFALGKIVSLKDKKGKRIIYHRMSEDQIRMVFNFFMSEFYFEIGHAQGREERLTAIARLIQRLEWLHPPCDGCGRTDTALLNYLLTCYGLHPVILDLPYRSSCRGLNEWIGILEEGLEAWEKECPNEFE